MASWKKAFKQWINFLRVNTTRYKIDTRNVQQTNHSDPEFFFQGIDVNSMFCLYFYECALSLSFSVAASSSQLALVFSGCVSFGISIIIPSFILRKSKESSTKLSWKLTISSRFEANGLGINLTVLLCIKWRAISDLFATVFNRFRNNCTGN